MSLIDDIKKDRARPQVKAKSGNEWRTVSDVPAPGWVQVCGPALRVSCPTTATDLNVEDYIARNADARRIARVPQMEAALMAAEELVGKFDELLEVVGREMPSIVDEDKGGNASFDVALAAYREATS